VSKAKRAHRFGGVIARESGDPVITIVSEGAPRFHRIDTEYWIVRFRGR
jgi:hypothetical protein